MFVRLLARWSGSHQGCRLCAVVMERRRQGPRPRPDLFSQGDIGRWGENLTAARPVFRRPERRMSGGKELRREKTEDSRRKWVKAGRPARRPGPTICPTDLPRRWRGCGPSGLNAKDQTMPWWAGSVARRRRERASQSVTAPSRPPAARRAPSRENASALNLAFTIRKGSNRAALVVRVPELHALVAGAGRGQSPAVRREGQGADAQGVAGEARPLLSRGRVPETDAAAGVSGGERLAVGRDGNGLDGALAARQRLPKFVRFQIPQLHALRVAGHRQDAVVGGDRDAADVAVAERQGVRRGNSVPTCRSATSQRRMAPSPPPLTRNFPEWAKATARTAPLCPVSTSLVLAGRGVPEAQGGVVAAGGQGAAVRREGHRPNGSGVSP